MSCGHIDVESMLSHLTGFVMGVRIDVRRARDGKLSPYPSRKWYWNDISSAEAWGRIVISVESINKTLEHVDGDEDGPEGCA